MKNILIPSRSSLFMIGLLSESRSLQGHRSNKVSYRHDAEHICTEEPTEVFITDRAVLKKVAD